MPRKVLLIGWDAADWKIINPLIDQGLMPTLNSFLNQGVMGNLATLQPVLSPMLWNSIATGKRPEKHGIHGFVEPDPQTGGIRPISSTARKVKAIWNILTQQGFRTHVIGWFAGHPAEPINGVCVSDLFPLPSTPLDEPWPLPPGAVHPGDLRGTFSGLRVHPAEIQSAAFLPFVPDAANVDQKKDKRLASLAKVLAETCSIHNAATWILENREWDFLAVYYNGIDHFCHGFMHFHPPRMDHIPEDLYETYQDVVNSAYRFHDMLLERLLQLAGPEATVLLVSDHGFHSDHLRPRSVPNVPAGAAEQHRPFGIVCMKGRGILKDERIYGATLLDITPTVLTLFGQPIGQDMDGRVLAQAFDSPPAIKCIPSWEDVPGEAGMHAVISPMDPVVARTLLQQFVALGYIQPPSDAEQKAAVVSTRELSYNLARSYLDSSKPAQAAELLEALAREWPDDSRFSQYLAQCYFMLGRKEDAKLILQKLMNRSPLSPRESSVEATGTPPSPSPARRPWTDWMMGVILYEENQFEDSLEHLLRAEQASPRLPNLLIRLGNTYLGMARLKEAARAFDRALEIDCESPEAFLGKATVELRQRRNEEAAESALTAVGLQHFLPVGHFCLGVALARLGLHDRAILAFETALAMQPGLIRAHRWLAALHNRPGGDALRAVRHRRLLRDILRKRQQAPVTPA